MEEIRIWLYPLGFLAAIAFSSRVLLQWLTSEVKGESVVMPAFWKLSLAGNLMLAVHALIQMQYHVCLIQACNAVISWRNLNLMTPYIRPSTFKRTVMALCAAIIMVTTLFYLQDTYLFYGDQEWFRIPSAPWQEHQHLNLSIGWHLLGFIGLALFSSRFWLQWINSEKHRASYLGSSFWWTSLIGESLCLIYFMKIKDPVNYIGPAFGLIPYVRNLILIQKSKMYAEAEPS